MAIDVSEPMLRRAAARLARQRLGHVGLCRMDAMRRAFMCCRQLDDAHGLLSCALSWASIHARFGEYEVAEQRLREAEGMAAEVGNITGQASCHLLLSLIKSAQV